MCWVLVIEVKYTCIYKIMLHFPGDMVPLGDLLIALYQSFEDVTLQAEKFVAAIQEA